MDLEIAHLVKRTETLEDVLKTLTSTNASVKHYLHKLREKMGECQTLFGQSGKLTCSICYTRPLEKVNIPCGHMICLECSERVLRRRKCFTCRSDVVSQHKIFI